MTHIDLEAANEETKQRRGLSRSQTETWGIICLRDLSFGF